MLRKVLVYSVAAVCLIALGIGTASAKKMLTTAEYLVYQGVANGYRVWIGTSTATSHDGISISGYTVNLIRTLAVDGDIATIEAFTTITADDGTSITLHLVGPINRSTGQYTLTGSVVDGSGDFARLSGNIAAASGQTFNPAGPFVIGVTYLEGIKVVEKHDYQN